MLIVKPFSLTYILLLLILCFAYFQISVKVARLPMERRKKIEIFYYIVALVLFITYKIVLSMDMEYRELMILSGQGEFNWLMELPLYFWSVSLVLAPFGNIFDSRSIKTYLVFVTPIGALATILFPSSYFSGYSLLLPRVMFYYMCHFSALIIGPSLLLYGLFKPDYSDIPSALLLFWGVGGVLFLISIAFRATGLCPNADFVYSFGTYNNPGLELLWKLIPIPYLNIMIPATVLGSIIMVIEIKIYKTVSSHLIKKALSNYY